MNYLNDVNSNNFYGKIFKSNGYGDFLVLDYKSSRSVVIRFVKTQYQKACCLDQVRKGNVKDPYYPSIYDVGVVGEKYPATYRNEVGKQVRLLEYNTWYSMLNRCYSKKWTDKHPTYKGCSVSDNFKHYEYFYEWCNKQIGFNSEGWHLDKDLLIKGNKVYSEDTCVFLPRELNTLLTKRDRVRGKNPIGVCYNKTNKSFISSMQNNTGNTIYLGSFKTPKEAFYTYKKAKEDFIKEQASKWKDNIDPRAYESLINYTVDIVD